MSEVLIGVVGAGTMGAGIAQMASAGHTVHLYDAQGQAAAQAHERIAAQLAKRIADQKLAPAEGEAALARITPKSSLEELAGCGLIIEAIVEALEPKRALFRQLEAMVRPETVLASNTSSLSITALGRGLRDPRRLIAVHFFNPVPAMRLVEIVRGLDSSEDIALWLEQLMRSWGKTPVAARSTPGFIVNRIARPFYGEALWLLQERRATAEQIDECLRAAGFRMGPCELMDLIGHDVNYAVTESLFTANYGDMRYVPSQLQRELVDAGRLGRKSGRGLYTYPNSRASEASTQDGPAAIGEVHCTVRGSGSLAGSLEQTLREAELPYRRQGDLGDIQLDFNVGDKLAAHLTCTDGRTAAQLAAEHKDPAWGVFDWVPQPSAPRALAVAFAPGCPPGAHAVAILTLRRMGVAPIVIEDVPGLIVARTIAMLVNEAADAVQQGICSTEAADLAMKLGVNYPAGPFEWLATFGVEQLVKLLKHLQASVHSERYRVSPWLQGRCVNEMVSA